jgi:hypothetical protein
MKKILFITAFFISALTSIAQKEINVKISGTIFNSPVDTFYVSQFFGNYYKDYHKITPDKKGNFAFVGKLPSMDYYILRVANSNPCTSSFIKSNLFKFKLSIVVNITASSPSSESVKPLPP